MPSEVVSLWPRADASHGRDAELAVLLRELDEAREQSRPRFSFVRGPAGVGKSHLFRIFRHALGARGVEVFEAESARDARRPFGLFAALIPALIEHLEHAGAPSASLAALARKVAPLTGPSTAAPVNEGQRLELFDAVCELFVLAGRAQPVFLFPDLDAADKASLELFRYLAAVVTAPESGAGGLFVASFRDDGALPSPLSEVLSRVSARTLSLAGLDLEGIRSFLGRPEVAQRLFEVTGGLPDALEELLTRPPARPVELFARRIERLGAEPRAVLEIVAAAPGALSAELVGRAWARIGGPAERAAAQLDALVREHVLTVKVVGGQPVFRFNRETEKAAFIEGLPDERMARARLAVGEALLETGDAGEAARLLLEVAPERGGRVAVQAAEALAARGAAEDAIALFERALVVLPADERPAIQRRLGELELARADFRAALRHFARARRRGDADGVRALRVPVARVLIRLGRLGLAERILRPLLQEKDGADAAPARVLQVELALLRGRPDEALALGRATLDAIADRPEQAVPLRNAVGRALLLKGALDEADRAFQENVQIAQANGLAADAARALVNRGVVAHQRGDREAAIRFYQAAAPAGERSVEARALANLGSLYADAGDFEPALEHLSRALKAFSRLGSAREVAHAASNLARLHAFLGDLPRAIELSEHALQRALEIGERYLQASALLNLGEAHLDRRELIDAARLFEDARTLFEEVGNDGYAALASAQKARVHLLQGDRAQAQAELSRGVMEKGCARLPAAMIEAELCRGDLALALGDLHGAGRATTRAREALLHKPDLEGPYRVYFLMGRLRLAAGDVSGAQAEFARAGRLLDEVLQRVPPARRQAFLSIPRRAEVLAAIEPDLRPARLSAPAPARHPSTAHGLVGRSEALQRITRQLEPIARSQATVLIRGESGTGKELLAQAIHDLSPRKGMPIIKVNCAAMVEELLLSELFGHEKGAFTGAIRERKGRFELADGGTLFLDEIGDISPRCQVALLRVLQEREFERVGGTKTIKVDVRIICATNRDLEALIAQGRFRQDLYYRLKGVMLELPPLRDRLEDLPILADHFLARIAQERNEPVKQLSGAALDLLRRHAWPGNVRELSNVLASAAIFADGPIITPECFEHIAELSALLRASSAPVVAVRPPAPVPEPAPVAPPSAAPPPPSGEGEDEPVAPSSGASVDDVDFYSLARSRGLSLKELRHQLEMQCIRRALIDASGNISEAARLLKMKRSRLSQIVNSEPELKGVCHGNE
ncbi:MAG: sigma 54-interacting transcriptional regulator [Myxococcaceae bacterium]|nr:sigma 54-interacting transcriptional regulator [Myxococcaceae bacterium]